jgi:hypothetical protein
MLDHLNTKNLLRRKTMVLPEYRCILYNSGCEETLVHLFFGCSFSQWCWRFIGISWDLNLMTLDMIMEGRRSFNSTFREISMLACWSIWRHLNEIIFYSGTLSLGRWKCIFREEFSLILCRAKPSLKLELEKWFCNFS